MKSRLSRVGRLSVLLFTSAFLVHQSSSHLHSGRLKIDKFTTEYVGGRFVQNRSLGVRFHLRQGFIGLMNLENDTLIRYEDRGDDEFYFRVLQNIFIGKKSLPVPFIIRAATSVKSKKTDHLNLSHFGLLRLKTRRRLFTDRLHNAIEALHGIKEITLLRQLSTALKEDNLNRLLPNQLHVMLRQFHVMRLALFPPPRDITSHEKNVSIVRQERVTSFGDERISQTLIKPRKSTEDYWPRETPNSLLEKRHRVKKRNGVDLSSDPSNNECLGLCGRGCTCMESVCGDCGFNRWCYGHDLCCRNDYMTTWCLLPFIYVEASCDDDFKGVLKCL